MRQGQQNRRGRGRNNNNNNQNRKGQNPLTRSFESTGPDVKIRGTPAHIAEKYMTLARDAQSSGDPVLAENYLQHAEHYNRIIMAFREQQIAQGGGDMANGGGMGRPRPGGFGDPMMSDDYSDDDGDDMGGDVHQQQPSFSRSHEPQQMQPRSNEGQRFEDRGPRQGHDQHRQPHHRDRERHGGEQRGFSARHDRPERQDHPERFQRPERVQRADPGLEGGGQQPARNDRMVPHHEQPEFLRRPVRRPRREGNGAPGDEQAAAVSTPAVEDTGD